MESAPADNTDHDGMDIDPAIAEAMGFSGFGMQTNSTNRKRKHGATDDGLSFVDSHAKGTGANATVSGAAPAQQSVAAAVGGDGKPTLEALRRGVRNAAGDMVYFLPSFIEDPWNGLEGK